VIGLQSKDAHPSLNDFLGKQLMRDIHTQAGLLLVQSGTILDNKYLRIIQDHRIELFERDVRAASFAAEQELCREEVEQATLKVQAYFDEIRANQKVPIEDIRADLMPHIAQAAEHPHLFGLLNNLQAKDDYTYRHNIGVGILAALLGKWLGLSDADVTELSMAATLHDIGKMRIPIEVLNKPGRLTDDEFELIKKHPEFGYEMLQTTSGATERDLLVALQHHERHDGSGYPYGIRGGEMDYFSRIVAVCDVYHAMSSKRSYHEPSPFYKILNQMESNKFGEFDPHIVNVFIDRMMKMMVGNEVLLSDARVGLIVMINTSEPLRPLVKIGSEFIDLRYHPSIQIEQVLV
jgi:HD-GYP domain-containing protein (c-di-GMP phosphodiesterase class II)